MKKPRQSYWSSRILHSGSKYPIRQWSDMSKLKLANLEHTSQIYGMEYNRVQLRVLRCKRTFVRHIRRQIRTFISSQAAFHRIIFKFSAINFLTTFELCATKFLRLVSLKIQWVNKTNPLLIRFIRSPFFSYSCDWIESSILCGCNVKHIANRWYNWSFVFPIWNGKISRVSMCFSCQASRDERISFNFIKSHFPSRIYSKTYPHSAQI